MLDVIVRESPGNEVDPVVSFDSEVCYPESIARLACSRFLVQWGRLKTNTDGCKRQCCSGFCAPGELVPVYNTVAEYENAALFHQLNLPSTLIRHENETFRFSVKVKTF